MPAMNYEQIAEIYDVYANTNFDFDFFHQETRRTSGPVLELMSGTGFRVETLYGDYARADFESERSPVMIWSLLK